MTINPKNTSATTSKIAILLLSLTLLASVFARNISEYFFDLAILFILIATALKKTPWSFCHLFYETGFNKVLWIFYGWIVFTILANPPLKIAHISVIGELIWIPALFIFARVFDLAKPAEKFFRFAATILTVIMIALIYYFVSHPESGVSWGLPNRLRGTFTNTNFLAHAYFLIFLFVWGLFVAALIKSKKSAIYFGLASLLVLCTLILTFNRSIWIALILTVPVTVFFVRRKLAVAVVIAGLSIFSSLYFMDFGGTRGRIENSLHPEKTYDRIRITLWKTNLKIFADNPITGVGYMNNKSDIEKYFTLYNVTEETPTTHPHNEIISFLAGTGLIGTLLYLSIFILFFLLGLKVLRSLQNDYIKQGLLLGALSIQPGFILAGFADNNFEIHSARNWLIVSWTIIIWLASEKNIQLPLPKIKRP